MADAVQRMIDALVGREGSYSNHPSDRGGPTKWGVTEQVARAYGYKDDMRSLPRDEAVRIYLYRYWTAPKFELVAKIFPSLAEEMFDTGVNMGPSIPAKFLQQSLNLLNKRGGSWPDMAEDGQIGKMTLDALARFKAERGAAAEKVLIRCLDGLQLARYVSITQSRPANEDFFFGWVANRIGELA